MFDCAEAKEWPVTMFKSRGTCETCEELKTCNEMLSKNLPIPMSENDEKQYSN